MSTETIEVFRYLLPIKIGYHPGVPDYIAGRWDDSVEGSGPHVTGWVEKADDGEKELPNFIVVAIEDILRGEQGHAWMLSQMQEAVR